MEQVLVPHKAINKCRVCGSETLQEVLGFGIVPIADRLIPPQSDQVQSAPLTLLVCEGCCLFQIRESIDPVHLYDALYPYFSSVSGSWVEHCRRNAEDLMTHLVPGAKILEVASNDGYMLRNFKAKGFDVLGIDPAEQPAEAAIKTGIPTLKTFFGRELVDDLRKDGKQFDLILANNVLAHVENQVETVQYMHDLLAKRGKIVVEVPYLIDLINHCEFDTIYHQHLCYFSLASLIRLFSMHGLTVNNIERIPTHGGSLRVFVSQDKTQQDSVAEMKRQEKDYFDDSGRWHKTFSARVESMRHQVRELLHKLNVGGNCIAAYGAAAKATTLMSYCGIEQHTIQFIVDKNPHKQGQLFNVDAIPIVGVDTLYSRKPDYLLVLAWNWADEIIEALSPYQDQGGKFIVPLPELRVC